MLYLCSLAVTFATLCYLQWTGKCIGEKTLRFFFAFLWSLMGLIAFVVAFVVISAVKKYELFGFKQHT
jgi:hypothetical protein